MIGKITQIHIMKYLLSFILLFSQVAYGQTAEEYFKKGITKFELQDFRGAISDYSKAIEINPKFANAYINRANAKLELQDNRGAIALL